MRRDDPVMVGAGSEKPDYDVTVPELRIKFLIGPEGDPDEVLLVWANGEYLVDEAFRDEIRQLADTIPRSSVAEQDVHERHFVLMGPVWYEFVTWLINQGGGALIGYLVGAGLTDLREKWRPRTLQFDSPLFDVNQLREETPRMEQLALEQAKSVVAGHFKVEGELIRQVVMITDMPKAGDFSATVVLRDSSDSIYTAVLKWDNGFRQMWVTRSYQTP